MARSERKIKSPGNPPERQIRNGGDPESYLNEKPSWNFHRADKGGSWAVAEENIGKRFWTELLPAMQSLDSMTWNDIEKFSNNKHHMISVDELNKCAQKRLDELRVYEDTLFSFRLNGTVRLYGIRDGAVFQLLWCDFGHGDNDTCVCRSRKKHT